MQLDEQLVQIFDELYYPERQLVEQVLSVLRIYPLTQERQVVREEHVRQWLLHKVQFPEEE